VRRAGYRERLVRYRSGGASPREDEDRLAYLNEMAHRLVSGRLLMSTLW
jgi:hypothetical protein